MKHIIELTKFREAYQLNEGGAYGHLQHIWDNTSLTFGDLKELIEMCCNGLFSEDNFVQEKTDGQNILISWINGKLRAARNGSHLKNYGHDSLSIKQISDMFDGRGEIQRSFVDALRDLEAMLSKVDQDKLNAMFLNGKRFMSLEIITPSTENTIPYGLDMLVPHGWKEFDEYGIAQEENKQSARELTKMIYDVNQQQQERFFFRGPNDLEIKPFKDSEVYLEKYMGMINDIMHTNKLSNKNTILDYIHAVGYGILVSELPGIESTGVNMKKLVERCMGLNKDLKINELKATIGDKEMLSAYQSFEKNRGAWFQDRVYKPIKDLWVQIGQKMIENISKFLTISPDDASRNIKSKVDAALDSIKSSGDEKKIETLNRRLEQLGDLKKLDKIIPSEGITFVFKGQLYKFTGNFSAINQIIGIEKYSK